MKLNLQNIVERSIAGLIASILTAIIIGTYNPFASTLPANLPLYIGAGVFIIFVIAARLSVGVRRFLTSIGKRIIGVWQLLIVVVETGFFAYLSYTFGNQWAPPLFVIMAATLAFVLTRSYFRNSDVQETISVRRTKMVLSAHQHGKSVVRGARIKDWNFKEIHQWRQPVEGYKPIPLSKYLVTSVAYPGISVPFERPYLGGEMIPFDLHIREEDRLLMGIEHAPKHSQDVERSTEIRPGAKNAQCAFVLLTSGNAKRIVDNVEFDGKRIGYLEFHYTDDSNPYKHELVLGINIRDWSFRHPDVVQVLTDSSAQQVWRDPASVATIDMLRIDFPNGPRDIDFCVIRAEAEDVPPTFVSAIPSIRLTGITYQLAKK